MKSYKNIFGNSVNYASKQLLNFADGEESKDAQSSSEQLDNVAAVLSALKAASDERRPKMAGFRVNGTFISMGNVISIAILVTLVVIAKNLRG